MILVWLSSLWLLIMVIILVWLLLLIIVVFFFWMIEMVSIECIFMTEINRWCYNLWKDMFTLGLDILLTPIHVIIFLETIILVFMIIVDTLINLLFFDTNIGYNLTTTELFLTVDIIILIMTNILIITSSMIMFAIITKWSHWQIFVRKRYFFYQILEFFFGFALLFVFSIGVIK